MPDLPADAVLIPESYKFGETSLDRTSSIARITDPLLGVMPEKGELSHIRRQSNGVLFVTKCPYDTMMFPYNHDRRTQPRYNWVEHTMGIKLGYLVEGATSNAPVE